MSSVAQRRLMSILVCRAGTVVSADSLAEHLELSPGALRTSVSRLRRIVGFDVLVTAPPGYELRSDNVDARRFEQLVGRARAATDPRRARAALEEALALWRGDAYDEFAHESWASAEARRLTELRAGAIEDLAELLVEAGEWTAAIATVATAHRDASRFVTGPERSSSARSPTRAGAPMRSVRSRPTAPCSSTRSAPSPPKPITRLDREIARANDRRRRRASRSVSSS